MDVNFTSLDNIVANIIVDNFNSFIADFTRTF